MSDIIKDFLMDNKQFSADWNTRYRILTALYAERKMRAKEVADLHEQLRLSTIDAANEMAENSDLQQRISELEAKLQNAQELL